MQNKSLISLIYDACTQSGINFGAGKSYHLNQALRQDEAFTDPPYFYLFLPIVRSIDKTIPSIGLSSYSINLVYLHVVDTTDNSEVYQEAQNAGSNEMYNLINILDRNDLISINTYTEEGITKFFDGYVGCRFVINITAPDDFDYCSLDSEGLDHILDYVL